MACLPALASVPGPSRRFAIVVGNDSGDGAQHALRYAETDARRVAKALTEVGGTREDDVTVLLGKRAADLDAAAGAMHARIVEHHQQDGARALLVFYFSGHSDGQSIELGTDHVAWSKLKELLVSTGADVRLAIIDACNSSAMLQTGARAAPAFQLKAEDQLTTLGEAFITSSESDESSLESGELKSSVFTAHVLEGMRGAADQSGDRLVSLEELYHYAYQRTAADGAQHPGYGFKLAGHGELIVGFLKRGTTAITLPPADRARVKDAATGEVLADLDAAAARTLALPPGRYELEATRDGQLFAGRFNLDAGTQGAIAFSELKALGPAKSTAVASLGITPMSGEALKGSAQLTVQLLPFTASGAATKQDADEVTAAVREALWQRKSVNVVDSGASVVVSGEIIRVGDRARADARVVDLANANRIVGAWQATSASTADVKKQLARNIADALDGLQKPRAQK